MKTLLLTAPMSNAAGPYPATTYLSGHLKSVQREVEQVDFSLELICRIFSAQGLESLLSRIEILTEGVLDNPVLEFFVDNFDHYQNSVETVVAFLQGREPDLQDNILGGDLLPEGPYLSQLFCEEKPYWVPPDFESVDDEVRARIMATYYLNDLTFVINQIGQDFKIESYSNASGVIVPFDDILKVLEEIDDNFIAEHIFDLTCEALELFKPDLVGISVPFSGGLLGAFIIARAIRQYYPDVKIVMGGAYPNTHLRGLSDPRVFDYLDFVALDDGERPLECILEYMEGKRQESQLLRTFLRKDGKVRYYNCVDEHDIPFVETVRPVYEGLPLDKYLSIITLPDRAKNMWSQKWIKLLLAHGCYWGRCAFCDTSLDYIKRYEPLNVETVLNHIKGCIKETGLKDFHWVDEAAPPALLAALAKRLLQEKMNIRWWGNIRFEKTFTAENVKLLAESGCVMVTGGLEVASDRVLKKMHKGVDLAQVAKVAKNFHDNGVIVHAYLIYGFPTETVQETINSLEVVRQLFEAKCLDSAHWHPFVLSDHSPVFCDPESYGITLGPEENNGNVFIASERPYSDSTGIDHSAFAEGLNAALRAYKLSDGFDRKIPEWFGFQVPDTTVEKSFIKDILI